MVTFRFYLFSLMMILVFLGLGILIGNSLGSEWMGESYQSIVTNLEKKLNQVSIEKNLLKRQITEAKSKNEELREAWLSFYKSHFGRGFKDKSVIILAKSGDQLNWLNILHEVGLKVKVVSSINEITIDQTDIIIFNQPSEEDLIELSQLDVNAAEMVINQKAIPTGEKDLVYYITLQNNNEKDMISILEGIYVLLSRQGY